MSRQSRDFLAKYGTALGGLVVFSFFALCVGNFLKAANLLNVVKQISYLAILSLGFLLALTTAELDLSFANICSLAGVSCGGLVYYHYPIPLAIGAGLGVGLIAGFVNGLLVTRLKVPSLIATLAMASAANGAGFWITKGVAYVGRWPEAFVFLGRGRLFGVPILAWWTVFFGGVAFYFLKQTRLGLHLTFTGENDEAARLAGIPVKRMKTLGLALSGLAAGIVGVLLTASLSSASPTSAHDFMLTSMAAVLLGMTMFEPGRPNVPGSLTGALTIGVLSNGLVLLGAPYYIQDIVLGVIIIASVSLSASTMTKAVFH